MFFKKLILHNFEGIKQQEVDLNSRFLVLTDWEEKTRGSIVNAFKAILFGTPPHRRLDQRQRENAPRSMGSNGSLLLVTEDGKEFLIGRDFLRQETEVFLSNGIKISPQPGTKLMGILSNELGTLNLLDYEAFFIFSEGELLLNSRSPEIREEIQRLAVAFSEKKNLLSFPKQKERSAFYELNERMKEVTEEIRLLQELGEELSQVEQEIKEHVTYERFLSSANRNLLEELSEELTAVTLERRYYEGQSQQSLAARATIEREISTLKKRIAAFDQELFSEKFQKRLRELARRREEKNALLEELQKKYGEVLSGSKGLFRRKAKAQRRGEAEINQVLQELAVLKKRIEELLKGRSIEEYLREAQLYKSYQEDLWFLENRTVGPVTDDHSNKLEELVRVEEEVKERLKRILAEVGTSDHKKLKKKVALLRELKIKKQELSSELSVLTGEISREEALTALVREREGLAERLNEEEEKEREEKKAKRDYYEQVDKDPVLQMGQMTAEYLAQMTEGRFSGAYPLMKEGQLELQVKEESFGWRSEETLDSREKELLHLAFRLALVPYRTPAKEYPLIFNNTFSGWNRESKERAYSLLRSLSRNLQVILLLDPGEELPEVVAPF